MKRGLLIVFLVLLSISNLYAQDFSEEGIYQLEKREININQNLSIINISDGKFLNQNKEYTFSILHFESNAKATKFLTEYLKTSKTIITGKNEILWLSNNDIISLNSEDLNIAFKLGEYYPLPNNSYFSDFSTLNFESLTNCWCGITNFLCNKKQCFGKGQTCYLNGFGNCVDSTGLTNGDDSYCRYREQRFEGCLRNEYDCDSDSECSGNLNCVDFNGGICLLGLECGCCYDYENWNGDFNNCYDPRLNHGEYDCNFNSDCKSGLVCDGNTPGFDFENDGCCYDYENWNTNSYLCNKAVDGKIYSVAQLGDKFIESEYGSLKLRVFIEDDDVFEDDVVEYFDVIVDTNGNFKFNPERFIPWWNNPTLFVDYKIDSIYAIEGNEIIGRWTNHYSNKNSFQYAEDWIEQIVRIHKDKKTYRKVEFPKMDSTVIFSSDKFNIDLDEEYINLKWKGILNLSRLGNYSLNFNSTGYLKLIINNKTVIDTENNLESEKMIKFAITNTETNLSFEITEKTSAIPKIYISYQNENFTEVNKSIFIKKETKVHFIKNRKDTLTTSEVIVNNQPDYMISFLEKPKIIRNQKPLIFVHGKHGESGYWEGGSQDYFNNQGYDAWEFYYPGDDYINISGALLGDALDYLKRNNYGQNQKFDIITHSMGGLVARSYVQNISPYNYKNDVNHLVMIGPPNFGTYSSYGIVNNIPFLQVSPTLNLICSFNANTYREFEESCFIRGFDPNSPIYYQFSLASNLVEFLSKKDNSQIKSLTISGNRDYCFHELPIAESIENFVHMEDKNNNYDCIVSHSSSSLLSINSSFAVISNKNHRSESSQITDYSKLILDFLGDKSDATLASDPYVYSYYNPKSGYKKNFDQYKEGSVQLKLLENGSVWNEFSTQDLIIEEIATSRRFNLTRNIQSKNYFHFNRQNGKVDSFYTIPAGEYKLIVPGYLDSNQLHFIIKPLETNFLEINLVKCIPSPEICDGKDNNCNNLIDEGISNLVNGSNIGACRQEIKSCINGSFKIIQNRINPINEICKDGLDNNCNGEIDDKEECFMILLSPIKTNYSDDRIFFDVTVEEEVSEISFIDWNDDRPKIKNLCRNCQSYQKFKNLDEGFHNITLQVMDNNQILNKNINFFIDSIKPKITKLEPRRGFSNGNLLIEFKEKNPKELILIYGDKSKNYSVDLGECIIDEDQYLCDPKINLSNFENQQINYWFELTDISGNSVTSRENKIKIDTIPPRLNSFSYSINKRKVNFVFNITELNLDEITYIDNSEKRPREKSLCSKLKNKICETSESFKSGHHNITLFVKDKAGNSIKRNIIFTV